MFLSLFSSSQAIEHYNNIIEFRSNYNNLNGYSFFTFEIISSKKNTLNRRLLQQFLFPNNYRTSIIEMDLSEPQLKFIFQKHKMEYIKKLGSGQFGTVYLANSIGQQFLPFAVKCITKKQLNKRPSLEKYLTQQINSMHSLKHPNIVKLIKTFIEVESFFLVMQYCEFGNLYSYQYGLPEKLFKLNEACQIFLQILKGLKAIHQENIIHRDIKCENILLKKVPKQNKYICKIGDFGFAKELSETAKSHCGTPNFMAPQILAEKEYDKCVDIWSIGVIMFYMLLADYPFKGLNLLYDIEVKCSEGYDLLRQNNPHLIRKKNKSIGQSQLLLLSDFFKRIFIIDTTKRITISEIYKHPLFQNYQSMLQNEDESPQSAQLVQQQRNTVLRKIEFIQSVQIILRNTKVLSNENQLFLKFLLQKVCLWIVNLFIKEAELNQEKQTKNNYYKKMEKILEEYKKNKAQLEKMLASKASFGININPTFFSNPYDKFEQFKDIYRTFLGFVFSQIHNSTLKDKERLKIRILCCHTINRVFQDPNSKYFAIFNSWNKQKIKQKKSKVGFNFQIFSKWIDEEINENISKTISAINEYFYTKK